MTVHTVTYRDQEIIVEQQPWPNTRRYAFRVPSLDIRASSVVRSVAKAIRYAKDAVDEVLG